MFRIICAIIICIVFCLGVFYLWIKQAIDEFRKGGKK